MTKKDILELKKRLKKNKCTFNKLCGCYVDINKKKILNFSKNFLNIEEEEINKYLEIAKKILSGNIGNNILNIEFKNTKIQNFLIEINKSNLKNDELLNKLYNLIIDNYKTDKNYLILLYSDTYDIINKTNDNIKIDESEYVFEYIICAICPVELTKPGLGYIEKENRIGSRIRDKIVTMPEIGFIFPAFSERNTDVNSIIYYTKNVKDTQNNFIENVLGCEPKKTITEQKEIFKEIISLSLKESNENLEDIFIEIQENINSYVDEKLNIYNKEDLLLDKKAISEIISNIDISEEKTEKIIETYNNEFNKNIPLAENMIDKKLLKIGEQKRNEKALKNQVIKLSKQIEDIKNQEKENNIILKTAYKKDIKTEIIKGKKYILIPIEENDTININGKNTDI